MEFFHSFLPSFLFKHLQLKEHWPLFFFYLVIPSVLLMIIMSFYIKHNSQAIDYWLFLGTIPSLFRNSNRLPIWFTEVFISIGKGSFFMDGPVFSKLSYLVTCHPQNLEYILKTNFNNFPKGPELKQVFDALGNGIFNVDFEQWVVQRKMAHMGFRLAEFKTLVATMSNKVVEEQLVPFLAHVAEQGSTVDLQEVCSRFAFDVNISLIFGKHDQSYLSVELPSNALAEGLDNAHETIYYRHTMPIFWWKLQRWLGIGREENLTRDLKTVDALFQEYISRKRNDLIKGVVTFDLLSLYINSAGSCDHVDLAKSDKFLRDAMLSLLLAGKDTISSGLVYFFLLVSKTPSVETKILEELKQLYHLQSSNKKSSSSTAEDDKKWPWVFDSDDVKGLVYLHAALCESLRLYPPVPLNSKAVLKEDILPDGTLVKPGMQILLSFYAVGRMPWIWGEDCLEFKPERWINDDDGKLSFEPMSKFFTFSVGPRSCIGKDISFTQMKSAVAAVLFNFHIEVVAAGKSQVDDHVGNKPSINLQMKNGLKVKIKKRVIN